MCNKAASRSLVAIALILLGASALDGQPRAPSRRAAAHGSFAGLPLDFVENRGQWDGPATFVARQGRVAAFLEPRAVKIRLAGDRPAEVSLTFDGASGEAIVTGEERRGGQYNFFIGNDPRKWRSNVPAFGAVRYRGLYQGVDLRVLHRGGQLEYDLLLAPGADLEQVVIRTGGASAMHVGADGALTLETAAGPLRQRAPVTWEELADGTTRRLESRFRKIDAQRYGFDVPGRDRSRPLVIDPGLEWSTFLGGWNREEIHGLALARDGTGDVVVAGHTFSTDFPTAPPGALGASPLISFVARLNSSGGSLVYATLFGGTNGNVSYGFGLALDASSAPVVVGETNAANFPTTPGAYQPAFNEPSAAINRGWDGYVTRFNASGSQMVFSTFLGAAPIFDSTRPGSSRGGDESARAVVVDGSDSVIVSGYTTSENFPTSAGAYDRTHSSLIVPVSGGTIESRMDAFISRFSPNGTQLTYSTYLGAQSDDIVKSMVIDAQGVLTLVGIEAPLETFDAQNNRTDHGIPFPTTPDAVARTHLGASDTFLARLSLDGTGAGDLRYATILGGFYIDEATSVALDPNNPELVTLGGYSRSWDFPTTPGTWRRAPIFLTDGTPYYAGFLVRFRFPATGGGSLVWSTLIEGTIGAQLVESVVVDASGDVIVVGTDEGGLPTTERSYKRVPSSGIFVSRFSGDGRDLLYNTFLHRSSGVMGDLLLRKKAVARGPHAVIVAGSTLFTDFPTTAGAFDRVFGSDGTSDNFHRYDGFVASLALDPNTSPDTTATAPALLGPANGATFPLGSNLTLDWSDVADASGVQLYEVAVNMNADFAPGFGFVFQPGAGFFTSSLSSGPTSQEGVFYWRVRTLDGVNNFSPWSEVRKFTLGAPAWTNFAAATLTPNGVVGGSTVQGKVHIMNAAPAGGQVYTLTSSQPSVASVPASVTVPAGSSSATFTVTTGNVTVSTPVMITVWSEGNGDHPILWVDPGAPGAATLTSLALTPTSVVGGNSSTGTVTLSAAAPSGGAVVSLSDDSAAATVPASVTVPAGATSATFTVSTTSVAASTSATISAVFAGVTRTATLTVTPAAPPPTPVAPTLVSPAHGATGVAQPVTLDWNDVANATSYEVQVDDTSTIAAPFIANPTVTVSQATLSGLPAQRLWWRVRAQNSAGVFGPFSATRRFTPQGAPAAATLSSVAVSPSSVVGGNGSTGTVTLTSAAPSGGALVSLSSSNTAVASVPASVTVSAGATSATFAVTTSSVTTSTPVTITATYNGTSKTTTLTVTPQGQAATLTVTATGRSGETVTSNPAGINVNVGTTGSASFTTGTSITLRVTNDRDAIWSGACSSGGNKTKTCTFTLTANASVTANVQ